MTKEQIQHQLEQMIQYLEAMKQDREEAEAFYEEGSEFMVDLDTDILLCSVTINDLTKQLSTKR